MYIGKKEIYTKSKLAIIKENKIIEYLSLVLDFPDLIINDNNLSYEFVNFIGHLTIYSKN